MNYLEQNQSRFNTGIQILRKRTGKVNLKYQGIIPELRILVHQRDMHIEISVYVWYKRIQWDCVAEFEVSVMTDKAGRYYCDLCEGKKREHFNSRESLIESHCFEEFRKWSNKNIIKGNSLLLYGSISKGATAARIVTPAKLKKSAGDKGIILPLAIKE